MTQNKIIEAMVATIPYPDQIENIDLSSKGNVGFDWRSTRFRVNSTLMVMEIEGNFETGSNISMLMSALLKSHRR